MAQCTANSRRTGERCGLFAPPGLEVCRFHGGATPASKAKSVRFKATVKAERAARLYSKPVDVDPAQALIDLVQWTAGEVNYWRARVQVLDETRPDDVTWGITKKVHGVNEDGVVNAETEEAVAHVEYRMLIDAQDRLAKYAAAALKAGVAERQVRIAEQQGEVFAVVIGRVLDLLELTPRQLELVPKVVPEQLRLLGS